MRSIDCQHPPPPSSSRPLPLTSPTRAPLPSLALLPRFASTSARLRLFFLSLTLSSFLASLHYFFYLVCFYWFYYRRVDPQRLFSVMAQLFVYMGLKKRFLMLRCHWPTRGWRTYCAEIELRSDIRDMQSRGNVLHSKISYEIGIFGEREIGRWSEMRDN